MKKITYLILSFFLLTGCQKGEEIAVFEELSTVSLISGFNGVAIFRNDEKVPVQQLTVKVPFGEANYRFEDEAGNILLEQMVNFTASSDTISLFNTNTSSILLRSLGEVAVNPASLKFDLVNLSSLTKGETVNLAAYKLDAGLMALSGPETIEGVTDVFSNEFQELDLADIVSEPVEISATYLIAFYLLDENMQPYLMDGYPVAFVVTPQFNQMTNPITLHKVYQVALADLDSQSAGFIPGAGAYPDGTFFYFAQTIQSK